MPRLLIIIILFVVSYLVIKSIRNKLEQKSRAIREQRSDPSTKTKMLKCDECGLHVPEHEAIKQGNLVFCSLEHARQRLE